MDLAPRQLLWFRRNLSEQRLCLHLREMNDLQELTFFLLSKIMVHKHRILLHICCLFLVSVVYHNSQNSLPFFTVLSMSNSGWKWTNTRVTITYVTQCYWTMSFYTYKRRPYWPFLQHFRLKKTISYFFFADIVFYIERVMGQLITKDYHSGHSGTCLGKFFLCPILLI